VHEPEELTEYHLTRQAHGRTEVASFMRLPDGSGYLDINGKLSTGVDTDGLNGWRAGWDWLTQEGFALIPAVRAALFDRRTRAERYLHIGGVVAVGFEPACEYLLVITHSGRGVFSTRTWERVARSYELAYPMGGLGEGIGPLTGQSVPVAEMDYETGHMWVVSPDERIVLECESSGIGVRSTVAKLPKDLSSRSRTSNPPFKKPGGAASGGGN
jgi:hypothetical protein